MANASVRHNGPTSRNAVGSPVTQVISRYARLVHFKVSIYIAPGLPEPPAYTISGTGSEDSVSTLKTDDTGAHLNHKGTPDSPD